jgi:hypothetical protein
MNDRELIAGLDLCRSNGDDLAESELRPIAQQVASDSRAQEIQLRIMRFDDRMRRSIHNVPVPADFQNRLLEHLRVAASQDQVVDKEDATVTLPSTVMASRHPNSSVVSRRRWLAWSGGLLAIAAAVVTAIVVLRPPAEFEREQLEASRQWHEQIIQSPNWQDVNRSNLDPDSLPSELRFIPTRYCNATGIVGREARAYDVTIPGGPKATLFVIENTTPAGVLMTAPLEPSTTQGFSVAYWQRGGRTYVVVVNSDRIEDYRALLRASAPQAA